MLTETSATYIAVQWFQEVWRNRDAEAIPRLMAPDARGHLEGGQEITGPEAFIQFHRALLTAIPDIEIEMLGVLGNETEACVRWAAAGTHVGEGLGFAPTNKRVSFHGVTWFRMENGQIAEGWDNWNQDRLFAEMAAL